MSRPLGPRGVCRAVPVLCRAGADLMKCLSNNDSKSASTDGRSPDCAARGETLLDGGGGGRVCARRAAAGVGVEVDEVADALRAMDADVDVLEDAR